MTDVAANDDESSTTSSSLVVEEEDDDDDDDESSTTSSSSSSVAEQEEEEEEEVAQPIEMDDVMMDVEQAIFDNGYSRTTRRSLQEAGIDLPPQSWL